MTVNEADLRSNRVVRLTRPRRRAPIAVAIPVGLHAVIFGVCGRLADHPRSKVHNCLTAPSNRSYQPLGLPTAPHRPQSRCSLSSIQI